MITHVEQVMGTVASITADPGEHGDGEAAVAIRAACRKLHEADAMFSTFRPDSPDGLRPPQQLRFVFREQRTTRTAYAFPSAQEQAERHDYVAA